MLDIALLDNLNAPPALQIGIAYGCLAGISAEGTVFGLPLHDLVPIPARQRT